jgi:hypothetical protein
MPGPWPRLAIEQADLMAEHLRTENPDPDFITRHAITLMHMASEEYALRLQAELPKAA